ncbi:MAG: type II toxin-antitoxin system RelE/ParE family toxin [Candidatus Omnitrophica bacterium]|nr:type II toxin-antitoxin system RelE/ParE family toxin [Candidatus Omnitrophota bacterium]
MGYLLLYHPDILKEDLQNIPANIKARIRRAIETRLAVDPVHYGEPLQDSLKGHRRLRVGDWRVIYRIDGQEIIILKIGNRKDVYQKIFRRLK